MLVVAAVFNPHVVRYVDEHLVRGGSTDTDIVTTLLCTLGCVTRPGLCDDTMCVCYQSWRDISTSESSSASQFGIVPHFHSDLSWDWEDTT